MSVGQGQENENDEPGSEVGSGVGNRNEERGRREQRSLSISLERNLSGTMIACQLRL